MKDKSKNWECGDIGGTKLIPILSRLIGEVFFILYP